MIEEKTYLGPKNQNYIQDPLLSYVSILRVKKDGMGYNSGGTDSPGDREFLYIPSEGKIQFQDNFTTTGTYASDPVIPFILQTVTVRFKY